MRFAPFEPGRLRAALLDLFFAPVCLGCDGPILAADRARLICRRCRSLLKRPAPPLCARCGAPRPLIGTAAAATCRECDGWPEVLVAARSACMLKPPADRLVHQLKYRGWKALAAPIAEDMTRVALPEPAGPVDVVVPVATTAKRQARRGYNQAALLARGVGQASGRRVVEALTRRAGSGTQTRLQPLERAANVAGAFGVVAAARRDLRSAHVLLIDDVLTTGATVSECALALAAAGARAVTVLTYARALG